MSYEEFMKELEGLLAGVPTEEKEEALQYYSDYFADAGKENEGEVISELGSPQKVAALIEGRSDAPGAEEGEEVPEPVFLPGAGILQRARGRRFLPGQQLFLRIRAADL